MIQISPIAPECLDYMPVQAVKYLEAAALDGCGDLTASDAILQAKEGMAEIYLIYNDKLVGCCCIMYGMGVEGKILDVALLGGENILKYRTQLRDYFIDLARKKQCKKLCVIGREGWTKIFPSLKSMGTVYMMDV